jgi:hypothetical protein
MEFPQKTKTRTTIKSNDTTPIDQYLKECTPGYDGVTCTPMFTAVLFTIALEEAQMPRD